MERKDNLNKKFKFSFYERRSYGGGAQAADSALTEISSLGVGLNVTPQLFGLVQLIGRY